MHTPDKSTPRPVPIAQRLRSAAAHTLRLLALAATLAGCGTSKDRGAVPDAEGVFADPSAQWVRSNDAPPDLGDLDDADTDPLADAEAPSIFRGAASGGAGSGGAGSGQATRPVPAASETGWALLLRKLPGADPSTADAVAARTAESLGLPDVRWVEREGSFAVVQGRYAGPNDPAAHRALAAAKAYQINGLKPYQFALLVPLDTGAGAGGASPYDLRSARAQYGDAARYTLQVAVYSVENADAASPAQLAEIRRAAEEAASRLRAEGEAAYFFHGRHRSMVTVGVFSEEDHDPSTQPPIESPLLRAARARHPHNLLNGQAVQETIRGAGGEAKRLQPSALVAIPK